MLLTFTVKVEVDSEGEKWVPYLKKLILGTLKPFARSSIFYDGWLTDRGDKKSETIEKSYWERGEIEI